MSNLIAHVDGRVSSQQQRHDVHVAFLRREVQRRDSLACHRVGGGAVLQQRGGDLHLILLGCDVKRRVAVLSAERETEDSCVFVLTPTLSAHTETSKEEYVRYVQTCHSSVTDKTLNKNINILIIIFICCLDKICM